MAIEIDSLQQRTVESRILEQSIAGLKSVIGDLATPEGAPPITVVDVGNIQNSMREVAREKGNVKLPYVAMQLTGISDAAEFGYNQQALYNGFSLPCSSTSAGGVTVDYKLRHVRADFTIQMLAQNIIDVINFTKRWKFRQREAQFVLTNEGLRIRIKVLLPNELTVPEQDMSDYGNMFLYGTNVSMYTFIGEQRRRARIMQLNLNTALWNKVQNMPIVSSEQTVIRRRSQTTIVTSTPTPPMIVTTPTLPNPTPTSLPNSVNWSQLPVEARQLPLGFAFSGQPDSYQVVNLPITLPLIIPANFVGTRTYCSQAASNDAIFTFNLIRNSVTTTLGTVTFIANSNNANLLFANNTTQFQIGDTLQLVAPIQDVSLTDPSITLMAQKV